MILRSEIKRSKGMNILIHTGKVKKIYNNYFLIIAVTANISYAYYMSGYCMYISVITPTPGLSVPLKTFLDIG